MNKQIKLNNIEKNTIVAISTPPGIGGIGIVRISGDSSINIASKIFFHKGDTKKNPSEFLSHHIYYGTIVSPQDNIPIDEVMLTVMRKPKTYTREDIVEINCHGGYLVVNRVLEIVNKLGARIAEPGEFTKLAFINGRIDLSQAEAVIDIIESNNEMSLKSSLCHLAGGLREKIYSLKDNIISLSVKIEAPLDFPDQGIDEIEKSEIDKVLKNCLIEVDELLDTVKYGQIIKEGINTIILGKTNVGKSSLFNVLLKKNKSIVTSVPGTTRDLIEGSIDVEGFMFNMIDTAGMKDPENIVEKISLERVSQHMEFAQIFLVMFDLSKPLDANDFKLIKEIESFDNRNTNKIIILNKADLPSEIDEMVLKKRLAENEFVKISVKDKNGIDILLKKMLEKSISSTDIQTEGLIISNKRHAECLVNIKNCLVDLRRSLKEGIQIDLLGIDLKYIASQLANITGESYDDEILTKVFSRFCIGK